MLCCWKCPVPSCQDKSLVIRARGEKSFWAIQSLGNWHKMDRKCSDWFGGSQNSVKRLKQSLPLGTPFLLACSCLFLVRIFWLATLFGWIILIHPWSLLDPITQNLSLVSWLLLFTEYIVERGNDYSTFYWKEKVRYSIDLWPKLAVEGTPCRHIRVASCWRSSEAEFIHV